MRERQSYLVTARLPLGLIASRPRQVSEHTFPMGHAHTQSGAQFLFKKGKTTRENDATGKSTVREKTRNTKTENEREK